MITIAKLHIIYDNEFYSLNDKPNLSYLEATLNEVQRIVGVAYMGIFRVAKVKYKSNLCEMLFIVSKCNIFRNRQSYNTMLYLFQTDITIGNSSNEKWLIPKNTIFTGALHEMMRDPDYFENPTDFLPER